ncbi:MAG: tetratricopeptide repeat protein, partial [Casimicrobium sp.]
VNALTEPLPEHTLWSSGVAYALGGVALIVAALLVFFTAALWMSTNNAMLVMLFVIVLAIVCATQTKIFMTELAGFTLSRLAVTKWRRESSVFVGNPPPQQDTAWIFRLRVMELTRSTSGFSSAPHFGLRVLARLADYALLAAVLLLLIYVIGRLFPELIGRLGFLRSPIVLPALVVLLAIPLEMFAVAKWRTTPGKFLLGVVVVTGTTLPDDRTMPDRAAFASMRALAFAKDVAHFGLWPITLLRWRSIARTMRSTEGSWEAAGDSVTLVRAAPLFMRAGGIALALALALGLAALWAHDLKATTHYVKTTFFSSKEKPNEPKSPVVANTANPTETTPSAATQSVPVTPPTAPPAPVTTAPTNPSGVNTSRSDIVIVPPKSTATTAPEKPTVTVTPPPKASTETAPKTAAPSGNEFEKQSALAQERRNRIERAEKRVAAARESGSYAGLQGLCENWTEDQPASADAWRCLGLARFQAGAGRDALPALRQALKLDPNDSQVEAAIFKILRP